MAQKFNITYFFGAGASCGSLPLFTQFYESVQYYIHYLRYGDARGISPYKELIKKFIADTEKHLAVAKKEQSMDVYASQLYFGKKYHELRSLKLLISQVMLFEQCEIDRISERITFPYKSGVVSVDRRKSKSGTIDKRYAPFLSTLFDLNGQEVCLPENVNVVTWNYDIQFELAYQRYTNKDIHQCKRELGVYPPVKQSFLTNRHTDEHDDINRADYKIIRLNGTCDQIHVSQWDEVQSLEKSSLTEEVLIEWLCYGVQEIYGISALPGNPYCGNINFAWEKNNKHSRKAVELAKRIFEKTEVLVVIGYSFPGFNRQIDSQLFNLLDHCKRIYVQDPGFSKVRRRMNQYLEEFGQKDFIDEDYELEFIVPIEAIKEFE